MKAEFTDVSETRKHLTVEVPPEVVDAEIERVAKGYSRTARVPGFRQGKVPAGVVRQRYKDQILYDVAHDMIPRLVGEALKERGFHPVATPDIRDVVIEAGHPLTFLADFETLPAIDPGTYVGLTARRPPAVLEVGAVDRALEHLQQRAARWLPVEDRPAAAGDTLLLDLTRTRRGRRIALPGEAAPPPAHPDDDKPETLHNVSVELGHTANPPDFDAHLTGTSANDARSFTSNYAADYSVEELAGATVDYAITVKGIRRKELLPIDDDFAKEVSELETLDALKERIKKDLQREAELEAEHKVRHDLLQELAGRLRAAPEVLVEREIDRRLEEFVRRLMDQGVDPMKAGIDWKEFRDRQRPAAAETVRSTLVIDEIARRESIDANEEDVAKEIEKFAERSGRTSTAVRARLEKEDGLDRIRAGIRREKTMGWLVEKANITS
jgi:trigger factor